MKSIDLSSIKLSLKMCGLPVCKNHAYCNISDKFYEYFTEFRTIRLHFIWFYVKIVVIYSSHFLVLKKY